MFYFLSSTIQQDTNPPDPTDKTVPQTAEVMKATHTLLTAGTLQKTEKEKI